MIWHRVAKNLLALAALIQLKSKFFHIEKDIVRKANRAGAGLTICIGNIMASQSR